METFKYLVLGLAVLNFSFVFAQATNPYPPTNTQYPDTLPKTENQNPNSFNTPSETYQKWMNNPGEEPNSTSPSITQPKGGATQKQVDTNPASAPDYIINNPP